MARVRAGAPVQLDVRARRRCKTVEIVGVAFAMDAGGEETEQEEG
jgi:hypothetical protein